MKVAIRTILCHTFTYVISRVYHFVSLQHMEADSSEACVESCSSDSDCRGKMSVLPPQPPQPTLACQEQYMLSLAVLRSIS